MLTDVTEEWGRRRNGEEAIGLTTTLVVEAQVGLSASVRPVYFSVHLLPLLLAVLAL